MEDKATTPGDAHKAFAIAIVALARQHKMDHLSFTFRTSHTLNYNAAEYTGLVTGSWAEGRHGAKNRIALRFDGGMSFSEEGEII